MAWFRIHDDMLDNPKVQKLRPELFKTLINLWCLAKRHDGAIPSNETIAFALREPLSRIEKLIFELDSLGFLDQHADGTVSPHDWDSHQYKSDNVAERVRKHREKRARAVTCSNDVTLQPPLPKRPQRQSTETEQSTEKKERGAKRATRTPKDWQPSPKTLEELRADRPDVDVAAEVAKYRDWSASAPKGAKLDHDAAFRNWVRRAEPSLRVVESATMKSARVLHDL